MRLSHCGNSSRIPLSFSPRNKGNFLELPPVALPVSAILLHLNRNLGSIFPSKNVYKYSRKWPLFWFPVATITNYHKHGGLRQHKSLICGSGDQKCKMGFTELESRGRQSYAPSRGSRRESGSMPFPAFRGCLHFLPLMADGRSHPSTVTLPLLLPSFTCKTTWIISDSLPISKSLI